MSNSRAIKVTWRDGCGDGNETMEYKPYESPLPVSTQPKPEHEVLVEGHTKGNTHFSTWRREYAPRLQVVPSTYQQINNNTHNCHNPQAACRFLLFRAELMELRMAVILSRRLA